jgi:hypothetical protein
MFFCALIGLGLKTKKRIYLLGHVATIGFRA